MITLEAKGGWDRTESFLKRAVRLNLASKLQSAAARGVAALAAATPVESGLTASSWHADVTVTHGGFTIEWSNTNENNGVNVAIILQYGHGTGTGGYVAGRDYINPAMAPVFREIEDQIWKEVINA